jgi:hypothetical protein
MSILPPLMPENALYGAEKRITVKLRKYWDFLREERAFPEEKEIMPQNISDAWQNCFVIKASNSCKSEDFEYKYFGADLKEIYKMDLTGKKAISIPIPEAAHFIEKYEQVLAFKRPVIDEGEITISKDEVIKYRQILLPFGEGGVNITAILGGMSYKTFETKKRFSLFGKK